VIAMVIKTIELIYLVYLPESQVHINKHLQSLTHNAKPVIPNNMVDLRICKPSTKARGGGIVFSIFLCLSWILPLHTTLNP
jgi:hypothetical protein